MNAALAIPGVVLAALAALLHVGIFALESVLWSRPSTWRRFGVADARDADVLRPMAYNQGFYNLFLAVGVAVGLLLIGTGASLAAGAALALFGLGSMILAAIVLVTSSPRLWRAALFQGVVPALAALLLALALVLV